MAKLRDPAVIPFLLDVLATEDGELAAAARDAIDGIKDGPPVWVDNEDRFRIELLHSDIPRPGDNEPRYENPRRTLEQLKQWWVEHGDTLLNEYHRCEMY